MMNNPKYCKHFSVTIHYKTWSHHIKTKKHERLAPNINSERMKVKELRSLHKDLNMIGFSTLKKKILWANIDKTTDKKFNEQDFKQMSLKQLENWLRSIRLKDFQS